MDALQEPLDLHTAVGTEDVGDGGNPVAGEDREPPLTTGGKCDSLLRRIKDVEAALDDHRQGFENLTTRVSCVEETTSRLSALGDNLASALSSLPKSITSSTGWNMALSIGSGLGLLALGGMLGSMGTSKYFFEQGIDFATRDPTNAWGALVDGTKTAASAASAVSPSIVALVPGA